MRYAVLLAIWLLPASALADMRYPSTAEIGSRAQADRRFTHSAGAGSHFGGLLGWQGRLSGERLHGRVGVGLLGVSVGVDVAMSDWILLGVTHTEIAFLRMTGVGLTYLPGGDYTEGWRFALDVGPGTEDRLLEGLGVNSGSRDSRFEDDEKRSLQIGISIGYAF